MINEKNTHIVNLSSYTSPSITEVKNDNYVEYGDNNDYFNYLIERITGSSTNGAIIKGISNLIYGKGLAATDAENRTSEWIKIMTYFRPSDLRKIIYDRKALGMAAIQVLYKKGKVVGTEHFPMQTLRPTKKDKFGKIKTWLYFNDWKNKKKSDEAEPIAAFGEGNGNEPEIYIWQGYVSGFEYFQPPEYIASLPYALLEEEIADYLINDAQNGFSPTTLLNFNNGVPEDQDKRRDLADEATKKLSGSKGKKLVITFNENKDHKATIDSIPLNDAPAHYEYLSKECFNKLIVGHSVTSPMLLGIRDGQSGLGNNADEIKNATLLFENIVIRVYQNQLIDIIKEICPTSLDLYFKTIQPLDFMQVDEPLSDDEEEKQTGVETEEGAQPNITEEVNSNEIAKDNESSYNGAQISSALEMITSVSEGVISEDQAITFLIQMLQFDPEVAKSLFKGNASEKVAKEQALKMLSKLKKQEPTDEDLNKAFEQLKELGEEVGDDWELVDEREVDEETEDEMDELLEEANYKSTTTLQKAINLVRTGTARPNLKSKQDETIDGINFKVRYKYSPETTTANSREFCKKMISANKIYRKEDLKAMKRQTVNPGFGIKGAAKYSIWKYKGGPNCNHKFMRLTFKKKGSIDVKSPLAPRISTGKAEREGYRIRNPKEVAMKPKDMPNNGYKR